MSEMYSVRLGEVEREKLNRFVSESGLSNKDFISDLISMYEMQKAKTAEPVFAEDIKELETVTRRMNAIYVNMVERVNSMMMESAEQVKSEKEVYEKKLAELSAENQRLKSELEISERERAQLEERAEKLEAVAADARALVDIKNLVELLATNYVPDKKVRDRLNTGKEGT